MTAQGEDILAWLDAAITHREATARAAAEAVGGAAWDGWEREVAVELPGGNTVADGVMYGDLYEPMKKEACEHIALHDPETVLRRCAADRRLMALHAKTMHSCPATDETNYLDEWTQFRHEDLCPVVLLLADGYGWKAAQTSAPAPAQTPPSDGDQMT